MKGCKAESKLQRLRAIHNVMFMGELNEFAVKLNQNYKD